MSDLIQSIPGATEFIEWFGGWPSFHDAEVLRICLDRANISTVEIHVFKMTSEVDNEGHYVLTNHAKLRFLLDDISGCNLTEFSHQNVIDDLQILPAEERHQIKLFSIYGVDGDITGKIIVLEFEPGIPERSVYRRDASTP